MNHLQLQVSKNKIKNQETTSATSQEQQQLCPNSYPQQKISQLRNKYNNTTIHLFDYNKQQQKFHPPQDLKQKRKFQIKRSQILFLN